MYSSQPLPSVLGMGLPQQAPAPAGQPAPQPPKAPFGFRPDGTPKGYGFLGMFKLPGEGEDIASEYSIADSEHLKDAKGNYLDYPTLVPTLTKAEVVAVLQAAKNHTRVPGSVAQKAEAFALSRKAKGLPLFAQPGEQQALYPELARVP